MGCMSLLVLGLLPDNFIDTLKPIHILVMERRARATFPAEVLCKVHHHHLPLNLKRMTCGAGGDVVMVLIISPDSSVRWKRYRHRRSSLQKYWLPRLSSRSSSSVPCSCTGCAGGLHRQDMHETKGGCSNALVRPQMHNISCPAPLTRNKRDKRTIQVLVGRSTPEQTIATRVVQVLVMGSRG